jgi:hypothetical protein
MDALMWTKFFDMHSGGPCKEPPYEEIFIEAPEAEARRVFYAKFGHNPDRVTCPCCGEDYAVYDDELPPKEPGAKTLVIAASDITPKERRTYVPEEDDVWH